GRWRTEADTGQDRCHVLDRHGGREGVHETLVSRPIVTRNELIREQFTDDGRFAAARRSENQADVPGLILNGQFDLPSLLAALCGGEVEEPGQLNGSAGLDDLATTTYARPHSFFSL